MGFFRSVKEELQRFGRSVDDNITQPIAHTAEAIISDPKKLATVALSILAPGAGTALGSALGLSGAAATIVGQAAINTALNGGDVKSAIIAAAIPVVGKELAGAASSAFASTGMDKALADSAGKVVSGAGLAAATGKDPLQALISGGLSEGTAALTREIPGFSDLPESARRAINTAVASELQGKDPTQGLINAAINAGVAEARNQIGIISANSTNTPTDEQTAIQNQTLVDSLRQYEKVDTPSPDAAAKEFKFVFGWDASPAELDQYVKSSGSNAIAEIRSGYDAGHTDADEAAALYKRETGKVGTSEDLAPYIGKPEADVAKALDAAYTTPLEARAFIKEATGKQAIPYKDLLQYIGMSEADVHQAVAKSVGFPDFDTQQLYGNDVNKYHADQNEAIAKEAGFSNYADYQGSGGDLDVYHTVSATRAGFPDYATQQQYNGDLDAYRADEQEHNNQVIAKASGFPDYATYQKYNGDSQAYSIDQHAALFPTADVIADRFKFYFGREGTPDELAKYANTPLEKLAPTLIADWDALHPKVPETQGNGNWTQVASTGSAGQDTTPGGQTTDVVKQLTDAGLTSTSEQPNDIISGAQDTVTGGQGADTTTGSAGQDTVAGGNDTVAGGNDTVTGGTGGNGSTTVEDADTLRRRHEEFAKYLDYITSHHEATPDFNVQDLGISQENIDSFNKNLQGIWDKGGFTSQWQTSGSDRIMVQDDGTAIGINENGESYALTPEQVTAMINNGQLNTAASGYVAATGGTGNTPGGSGGTTTGTTTGGTGTSGTSGTGTTNSGTRTTTTTTTPTLNTAAAAAAAGYMPTIGDVAHIKWENGLFGVLPWEEQLADLAKKKNDGKDSSEDDVVEALENSQYATGGHVDDFSVEALLQILRS